MTKKFTLLILFSILHNFFLKSSEIVLHNELGLFSSLGKETITQEIFQYLPMTSLLKCGELNTQFYKISRDIAAKRWCWEEQIPPMCNILPGSGLIDWKMTGKVVDKSDFIQNLYKNKFKMSIPYFCFHNLFHNLAEGELLPGIKNQKATSLCSTQFNQLRWHENLEIESKIRTIDTNVNDFLDLSDTIYDDKSIVLILRLQGYSPLKDDLNVPIALKKIVEISKKINSVQIKDEIKEAAFSIVSSQLKKIGNKLPLAVAPLTRLLCIQDNINIVLPKAYKDNEKTFKPLIDQLFTSKTKNSLTSIYSKENIDSLFFPTKVPLEILDPWLQLTSILGLYDTPFAQFLYAKVKDVDAELVKKLSWTYNTRYFKVESLKLLIDFLFDRRSSLNPKNISPFIWKYVKKSAIQHESTEIIKKTAKLFNECGYVEGILGLLTSVKESKKLQGILAKTLKTIYNSKFSMKNTLLNKIFSSDLCVALYQNAIQIPNFISTRVFYNFQKDLIENYFDLKEKEYSKSAYNKSSLILFEKEFLNIMNQMTLDISQISQTHLSQIFAFFRYFNFLIKKENIQRWLTLMDKIANKNITFYPRENIIKYIDHYINLHPDPKDSINYVLHEILKILELESTKYSEELQAMFSFTLCKNRELYGISDDLFEKIITRTHLLALDLIVDWMNYFQEKKENEKYAIKIIKMLVKTAKTVKDWKYNEWWWENGNNSLFSVYIEACCTSNLLENLSIEDQEFLKKIAYRSTQYYGNIEKILQQSDEDKKINCLQEYYTAHKNNIRIHAESLIELFETTEIDNEKNRLELNKFLKDCYKNHIDENFYTIIRIKNDIEIFLKKANKNKDILFLAELIDIALNKYFVLIKKNDYFIKEDEEFLKSIDPNIYLNSYLIDKCISFYQKCAPKYSFEEFSKIILELSHTTLLNVDQIIEMLAKKLLNELKEKRENINWSNTFWILEHICSIKNLKKLSKTQKIVDIILHNYITNLMLKNADIITYSRFEDIWEVLQKSELSSYFSEVITHIIENFSTNLNVSDFRLKNGLSNDQVFTNVCGNLCRKTNTYPFFKPLALIFCKELEKIEDIISIYRMTHDPEIKNLCKKKLLKAGIIPGSLLIIAFGFYLNQKYDFLKTLFTIFSNTQKSEQK